MLMICVCACTKISIRNQRLVVTSARTYPFIFPWSFSLRPNLFADDFWHGMKRWVRNHAHLHASASTYPAIFPLGLAQQGHACPLMICVLAYTQIRTKSAAFRRFSAYVSPCFQFWSSPRRPAHLLILAFGMYLP